MNDAHSLTYGHQKRNNTMNKGKRNPPHPITETTVHPETITYRYSGELKHFSKVAVMDWMSTACFVCVADTMGQDWWDGMVWLYICHLRREKAQEPSQIIEQPEVYQDEQYTDCNSYMMRYETAFVDTYRSFESTQFPIGDQLATVSNNLNR